MYSIVIQPFKDDEPVIEQSTLNIVWVLKLDQEYHLFLSRAYISIHTAYAHINHIILPTHCAYSQLKFCIHANVRPISPTTYLGSKDILIQM